MANELAIIMGAGPGLGQALARRFAQGGMDVALIARDEGRVADMAERIAAETGRSVRGFEGDGTRPDLLGDAIRRSVDAMGHPRVFIQNASRWIAADAATLDPAVLVEEMTLGAAAALAGTQAVLPAMTAAGRGTVLWTGSAMGLRPEKAGHASPALAAGKAALRALALASAKTFHERGVNFATITIDGTISKNGPFSAERIAEGFWNVHDLPRPDWRAEHVYDGTGS